MDVSDTSSARPLVQALASNWWILLIRGILLVALGCYALFEPGQTLLAWAFVLGFFMIADGILAIIAGIAGWTNSRIWALLRGVLAILVGAFAIGHPAAFGAIAGITVIFVLAGASIVSGIFEITVAIRERKAIEGEGWMILNGVFSILFGVVLILAPLLSLALFIRVCGVFAIIFGIVAVFTSFKLRGLKPS
ncbi:HdeD family acid-resistance protein [Haloferula sp.]|uniref:HdeD family acid-resistance protein n=1 Tax=Haloferula sp. TaxID=2497595 RepID=UPI00329DC186